uniref:Uncharacterized protein n=1 Tax=Scleropages formosus TaxID=113540 RepID=A0A8C9SG24_SCLFO
MKDNSPMQEVTLEPLADLSARRCPKHQEMLRFYCMDECAYICADCVLEGTHTQHQVKGLRVIEDNLKVTLRDFLRRAEERLKESKRLLEEQEALESMLAHLWDSEKWTLETLGVNPAPSFAVSSPLTLDTNSAHPRLSISDDLRTAMRVSDRLPCSPHPDRFDHWSQVLTTQSFSSGLHYWEVEAEGSWDIAVVYGSIGRKGRTGTAFGSNRLSWSLMREHDGKLAAWHNKRKTRLNATMSGTRVSISLDYRAGKITFCEVGAELTHLHTFNCSFTQPVHLGFGLYKAELSSRISIVTVKDILR